MRLVNALSERLGLNAYTMGDMEKAEKWFKRLERSEPDSMRVLRNLGVIAMARGDTAAALHYLRREEGLYGETWHRHRALADLYYSMGRREDALLRYTAALKEPEAREDSPQSAFILERKSICGDKKRFDLSREAIALFEKGERARDGGNPDEALKLFTEAAEKDRTMWPALNNAGSILLSRGDFAGALELFERALGCAKLHTILRNRDNAREAFERGSLSQPVPRRAGRGEVV